MEDTRGSNRYGHSERMTERKSKGHGTLHLMAKTPITLHDWRRKFLNRVERNKIPNTPKTRVMILSGMHGNELGWSGYTDMELIHEAFYEEDIEAIDEFKRDERTDQIKFNVRFSILLPNIFTNIIAGCKHEAFQHSRSSYGKID